MLDCSCFVANAVFAAAVGVVVAVVVFSLFCCFSSNAFPLNVFQSGVVVVAVASVVAAICCCCYILLVDDWYKYAMCSCC